MTNQIVEWCSSQWFSLIHGNNLVYNTCWEDPRIDRVALDLSPDDVLLMITSAGCNALDYALVGPRKIHAVDMNPRQSALLELKIAGIKSLDFETFFEIFGKGRLPDFQNVYTRHLREHLSPESAAHWDRRTRYFTGTEPRESFYFRGSSGTLARWLNHYIDLNKIREPICAIFEADSVAEQEYIYKKTLHKAFWSGILKWMLQWDLPFAFVGVPRTQRREVEANYQGGMRQFLEDCLEAVFARLPLKDNYFWWLYLNGSYSAHRCPEYLKRENFLALKSGLVDRISVHTKTLVGFMKTAPEQISRFVLLDHMDWLRGSLKPVLTEEWNYFIAGARPNARMLWRSASLYGDFVNELEVNVRGSRTRVGELLDYHPAWAKELTARDRVHTYGSFCIADLVH
jgi:S-adenosylmethionine-diacylglycerol 3-amino-3-carboxypropyl transferase